MEIEAAIKRTRASSGILVSDRLSALPDCLLHHIMSFMKARQVVQTCVLSTRWTHLWRSVPSLDIDLDEFRTEHADHNREDLEWEKFLDFTDHLLIPNKISIALLDTFRLHVSNEYHFHEQATRWIRHAIKYSAQVPGVRGKGLISSSWRIKHLHLSSVFLDGRFTEHVSSGCPYLEDLELTGCSCTFHEITSHSLKNLILKSCRYDGISAITSPTLRTLVINGGINNKHHNRRGCLTVVTAPVVVYLLVDVRVYRFSGGISLNEMPSVAKASIHMCYNKYAESNLSTDQIKLLGSVSNVTALELLDYQTVVLGERSMMLPDFKNLRVLLLHNCDLSDKFKILAHFMKNSPNMEKLTLRFCKFSKYLKKKNGTAKAKRRTSSQCMNLVDVQCKNLKFTEIVYKEDDVCQLVELLLSISGKLPKNNIKLTKVD